jgi:hypothetical protein
MYNCEYLHSANALLSERSRLLPVSLRVTPQRCGAVQSESDFNCVIANGVKQSLDCRNLILAPELGLVRQSSPRRPSFLVAVFAKKPAAAILIASNATALLALFNQKETLALSLRTE